MEGRSSQAMGGEVPGKASADSSGDVQSAGRRYCGVGEYGVGGVTRLDLAQRDVTLHQVHLLDGPGAEPMQAEVAWEGRGRRRTHQWYG